MLAWADLLHVLNGTIFHFEEDQMLWQPTLIWCKYKWHLMSRKEDAWGSYGVQERMNLIKLCENQRLFGASSLTCAIYTLNGVGLDNDETYPTNYSKRATKIFLHGRFPQMVRYPWQCNCSLQSTTKFLFGLKNWISNNVSEAVSEGKISLGNTKQVEVKQNRGIISALTTMVCYW